MKYHTLIELAHELADRDVAQYKKDNSTLEKGDLMEVFSNRYKFYYQSLTEIDQLKRKREYENQI